MRDHDNIRAVAALEPGYMGFIEYKLSPRYVGDNFIMAPDISASITRVGVFVNESSEIIVRKAASQSYKYVQLHGNEVVTQCRELKAFGLKVIKVFSIGDNFDFTVTRPFVGVADYFLFDTKGRLYGGNARRFDWNVLKQYDQEVPFFLSGGISTDNLDDLGNLKGMNLYALDLNSGVEVSPGLKDVAKVSQVMNLTVCLR